MGLFQVKKVTIEKIDTETGTEFLIDYFGVKDHDSFVSEFVGDMINHNNCLMLINTNFFYGRKKNAIENKIIDLKAEFDQRGFTYREIVTEQEADNKIFGIRLQKGNMVNCYQIGLAVTKEQIADLIKVVKDCNIFYYPDENNTNTEELLDKFNEAHGKYEELNKIHDLGIYVDSYFRRIRIFCKKDKAGFIEDKLGKYK